MFTEITEDTISATDSCQMETTGTTLKVSPATQPTNQVTSETYTVIPPRRTFNEQKPFVFSIIGFAVFYIIALIVGRVIKMRLIDEIAEIMGVCHEKALNILKELDEQNGIGLVKKKRRGQIGRASCRERV